MNSQTSELEATITLKDPSGYAVINFLNCPTGTLAETGCHILSIAELSFHVVDLGNTEVVAATVDYENVSVVTLEKDIVQHHMRIIETTPIQDFDYHNPFLVDAE